MLSASSATCLEQGSTPGFQGEAIMSYLATLTPAKVAASRKTLRGQQSYTGIKAIMAYAPHT